MLEMIKFIEFLYVIILAHEITWSYNLESQYIFPDRKHHQSKYISNYSVVSKGIESRYSRRLYPSNSDSLSSKLSLVNPNISQNSEIIFA